MSNFEKTITGSPIIVPCESPLVVRDDPTAQVFHYTNFETLEKILTNRTLRFSRIDTFDDGQEAKTFPGQLAKQFFASCWTSDERDAPPLWRAFYTSRDVDPSKRLRIALRRKPFCYSRKGVISPTGELGLLSMDMAFPFSFVDMHTEFYSVASMNMRRDEWFGRQVSYVEDVEGFYAERFIHGHDGSLMLQRVQDFATHKELGWADQKEYRFVLMASPRILGIGFDDASSAGMAEEFRLMAGMAGAIRENAYPSTNHIDMPINIKSMSDVEILLGPMFSSDSIAALSEMVLGACPDANITKSIYTGKMVF